MITKRKLSMLGVDGVGLVEGVFGFLEAGV